MRKKNHLRRSLDFLSCSMQTVLITGASGNVGSATLKYLSPANAIRVLKASREHQRKPDERYFDFEDIQGSLPALEEADVLFLLRPPQLSDVPRYFTPLISACKACGVQHIVFLSVQGADRAGFIPHAKIEKLILESGIPYTFLRPSYFMQNLTTTLLDDIRYRHQIFLPAGNASFLWIDVDDIGRCAASVLQYNHVHRNQIYTLTGTSLLNFREVAALLSEMLGKPIEFVSPGPLRFYRAMRQRGMPSSYILVLLLLHFLPRFQKPPLVTNDVRVVSGREPRTLADFLKMNTALFQA